MFFDGPSLTASLNNNRITMQRLVFLTLFLPAILHGQDTTAVSVAASQTDYSDIIKTVMSCAVLIALIFTAIQIKLAKRTILFNGFKSIYDDHFRIRKHFEKAVTQREELLTSLKINSNQEDINLLYGKQDYAELREVGYHYEYIGILVKRKILPLELCFDLLPFPDKFWNDSQEFIKVMRENYLPDFWENFEYLKEKYNSERTSKKQKK
jgi:hypothetical protein